MRKANRPFCKVWILLEIIIAIPIAAGNAFGAGGGSFSRHPSAQAARPLVLKEIMAIGAENAGEALLFRSPVALRINDKSEIFVLDDNPWEIRKFSPDGKPLGAFGRQGQGPGEIGAAQDFVIDGAGNIIVFDFGNHRLTRFNSEGRPIDTAPVDVFPLTGAAGDGGFLYILSRHNGKLIHKIDPSGRTVLSFFEERKANPPRIASHVNQSGRLAFRGGRVYAVMAFPYEMHVFDANGNRIGRAPLPGDFPVKPTIYPDSTVLVNFQIRGLDLSGDGRLFVTRLFFNPPSDLNRIREVLRESHRNTGIDVTDGAGIPLGAIESTRIDQGIVFGPDGRAYALRPNEEGLYQIIVYSPVR